MAVCFGELGWRAGDELFVVGWELDFDGVVERGRIARKRWEAQCNKPEQVKK